MPNTKPISIPKILGLFLLAFGLSIITIKVFHFFFSYSSSDTFIQSYMLFDIGGLFIIFLLAFIEEFCFRFIIRLPGWVGAGWLVFVPYFTAIGILNRYFQYRITTIDFIFLAGCFSTLIFIYLVYKNSKVYKQLFMPSKLKIAISVLLFSIIHISNYNFSGLTSLVILLGYNLILHVPFSILLTYIQFTYKNGLFWATFIHFLNNSLALLLALYLPNI
jgi:membrane protease YdiL (CAAX protease family)